MAILTGPRIRHEMGLGNISIIPPPAKINPNSVNLSLGKTLLVYNVLGSPYRQAGFVDYLDPKQKNPTISIDIPEEGYVLLPGVVYLATTVEFTKTFGYVPVLEGRSSLGRLGLSAHICAGYGETGFCGEWTCELLAVHPVLVFPYQQICQLSFHTVEGEIENYAGKYNQQRGPVESRFWQEAGEYK